MISSWKKRRAARRAVKTQTKNEISGEMELSIPKDFRCPISLEMMKDPVTLSTGITYDRVNIEKWIEAGNFTCPITNQKLVTLDPIPNHSIRKMIQNWCVENTSHGIERIPTPRIPVTSGQVSEILSNITACIQVNDRIGCVNLVSKIKRLVKESERNKKCFVSFGTVSVLSSTFDRYSRSSLSENASVLGEILSTLTIIFPLDSEARSHLGSTPSISCLVWFLKGGDLSSRRNAVLVLKDLVCSDQRKAEALTRTEGAIEAVFKLIKEPICPTTTKASLVTLYQIATNQNSASKLADMGIVSVLTEILVGPEKSICEKALAVLDGICGYEEGRNRAYENLLTVPVVVKKMHRVTELATEFSVGILWKLCKNGNKEERRRVVVEAVQVGAFQKLLLQLQVGCGETMKERATELLKMLNPYREKFECIDSSDFKDLKRP